MVERKNQKLEKEGRHDRCTTKLMSEAQNCSLLFLVTYIYKPACSWPKKILDGSKMVWDQSILFDEKN